jgi:MarR family transcriptional regulator, organic hydroperoxide resistance regulator
MARAVVNKDAVPANRTERRAQTGNLWLDTYVPYRLYRVAEKLGRRLQSRLRPTRIRPPQWRVLSVIRAYGALSVSEIVDATLMEQPTISRVVAKLEKDGLATRRLSTRDSRMTLISLTNAGLDLFKQIAPAAVSHQEEALQGIGHKEIAQLLTLLDKIEKNVAT